MPPLSIMVKPASSLCNYSCEYCFYKDVSAHREQLSFGKMKNETAAMLIEKALDFADGCQVSFVFQGGEPTLAGLNFFEFFVKTVKEKNKKKSKVFYSLQTNGSTADESWARFYKENKFLIGLSLDGDFDGSKFRKNAEGKNSFYEVLFAAELFKKYGVEFNILTVLTGYCANNCERIYRFFKSNGFKYLQFIPCLRPFGSNEKSELYMTSEQYASFLIKIFTLYVKDYKRGKYTSVRQFDNMVRLYLGQPAEQCGMHGFCSHQFVCESGGEIYPCDFYCTDEFLLGNILKDDFKAMAFSKTATDFIKESLVIPEKCKTCRLYPLCRAGGCKRTRQSEDYCEAYKKFYSACLPMFETFANGK